MADAVGAVQAEEKYSLPNPPLKMSEIPAWGMGLGLGEKIAEGFKKSHPDLIAALAKNDLTEADFTNLMKGLMVQVTKSMQGSTDALKEMDDDDGCAATAIYK